MCVFCLQNFLELEEVHTAVADHDYFKLSAEDSGMCGSCVLKAHVLIEITNTTHTSPRLPSQCWCTSGQQAADPWSRSKGLTGRLFQA